MNPANETVAVTREYYNSSDADNFYATVWGGEDIHIGLYREPGESIYAASRRTVETMAGMLPPLSASHAVLDLGSGYGGSARYLAERFGCQVTCLNLSEVQNQTNRAQTARSGLTERITVMDGSFEDLSFAAPGSFDVVWSQDAILHSGQREQVLREVDRVLKPGGQFIFTDPMQSDGCPAELLAPVLQRIHLASLGSPGFYRRTAGALGWQEIQWLDRLPDLVQHYARVREEVCAREAEILKVCSGAYIERMKAGLQHWVDAGRAGRLQWGIFVFRKPEVRS
ncbi:MAG TPA: methyltransferase domain-containing protein [Verrucomicrobiota bacterium]|nr:methyltransferase domain-containing protein [Verrucomicrobiota bacterium]